MTKIAVIMFPGNNCENETARAIIKAGLKADILRWNDTKHLKGYDGYVLPGGWAYEDRIRAGIIPAKDPVMNIIKKEAANGRVVVGICNGCQVVVETAIAPGLKGKVEMALAPNINPFVSGFYCTWINVKNVQKRKTAFNLAMDDNEVLPIPIAHAEGRFTTIDKDLINKLNKNDQIIFKYCDKDGNIIEKFPVNPNSAMLNIAGITNKQGNVLAMMPHPERASLLHQVPNQHKAGEQKAPAIKIFESIKEYLK